MKNNGKEFEIEELVFRVFMKHVKANNLYIAFRWSVNFEWANKDFVHVLSSTMCADKYFHSKDRIARFGGAFIPAHSVNDILKIMNGGRGKRKIENDANSQLTIMNMINMLIHNCIEHAITDNIHVLEEMGSAVFEEVGKSLFGNDFKDLTEEAIDPNHRKFMKKMQALNGNGLFTNEFIKAVFEKELKKREEELYVASQNMRDNFELRWY